MLLQEIHRNKILTHGLGLLCFEFAGRLCLIAQICGILSRHANVVHLLLKFCSRHDFKEPAICQDVHLQQVMLSSRA